jgi:hypothetical protein
MNPTPTPEANEKEDAAMEEANPYQNKDKCYERNCFNRGWKARAALPSTNEGRDTCPTCGDEIQYCYCPTREHQAKLAARAAHPAAEGREEFLAEHDENVRLHTRVEELEAQLAEKDARIERLEGRITMDSMEITSLKSQLAARPIISGSERW